MEQLEDDDYIDINAQALLHYVPAADGDDNPIDDRRGKDLKDELCRQLFQRQMNK